MTRSGSARGGRSAVAALALAFVGSAGAGCAGSITGAGNSGSGGDDDSAAPDAAAVPTADAGEPTDPVARAMEWVIAEVPYCQAANHQPDADSDCAAICTRPDNPDWDAYRSDCSGLVSWAWSLPPPGRTTATLAPFDTAVSTVIAAADLQPGDAINNDTHTMLFVAWTSGTTEAQFIEEPGCSASQPYAREVTVTLAGAGSAVTVDGYGTFTSIRRTP